MRKALAAVLVLLLLLCGVTVYAFCAVMEPKEKVSYEESVFYGDRSAADGVTISLKTNFNHNLFWDSDIRFSNGDYSCETEYAFSASMLDEESQTGDLGVFLWTSDEIISDGFTDTIEKHLEGMKPGEEDEFELRLADFYDYYPITGRINLPESFQWFSPEIAAEDTVVGDVGQYNGKKLSEFFRIPVNGEEYYTVSVKKDRESAGSYQSYTSGHGVPATSDEFYFRSSGVCTEDACYFWFPNRTNYDIKIDTSMIPGGYGIYILPYGYVDEENYHGLDSYEGIDVNVDELRVFYPIDENVRIKALGKSGDNKELILHAIEDGKYYVNIIDAKTASLRQKLEICVCGETDDWYSDIYEGENFEFLRFGDRRAVVIAKNADGVYSVDIDCDISVDDALLLFISNMNEMKYDGERLVMATANVTPVPYLDGHYDYRDRCGFSIAVIDSNGLGFLAGYVSELEKSSYYAGNLARAIANYYNPLSIGFDRN